MSKYNIWLRIECQNRIVNIKIRYSAPFRMSKYDIECQNVTFCLNWHVKIGFSMSKYDIWPLYECQNRIWNVKI